MELYQQLQQLGLEEKQAKIYLAALELGPNTVLNIAEKADIKRSTAYIILKELIKKGLINITPKQKTTLYTAENPRKLLTQLKEKQRIFKKISPFLQAINNQKPIKPNVRFYQGREAMLRAYDEIYKAKKLFFFGSIHEIMSEFPEILEKTNKIVSTKHILVKDLLCSYPEDLKYAKKMTRLKNYKVRILPKKFKPFSIDCAIFENRIAIFSYFKKEFIGVIIDNKGIAESFRTLHGLAWLSAQPFK